MLDISTPALFFPCVSLLMVAYTNRFIALSQRIRALHHHYQESPDDVIHEQIQSLRKRVSLIRNMQILAITSLFFCFVCMFLIFSKMFFFAEIIFTVSILFIIASLGFSLREIILSVHALDIFLDDFEKKK